ncbi:MAG: glycogen debranching protein [Terriglobia bacterium]
METINPWTAIEGSPNPLGVTRIEEEQAYNFALFAAQATGVTLLLYSDRDLLYPIYEQSLDYLTHRSGAIWHARIPASTVDEASYYAYRVDGPFAPEQGQRFDADKILMDPYAKSVYFPPGFARQASIGPGSNAGKAPLGLVQPPGNDFDWGPDQRPIHTHDAVIYELHVRGFTRRSNSGVAPEKRGTYAGLIQKIPYLQDLGITAVELMPVFQFDPQEGGYWGYMPLNFFAPHHEYAQGQTEDQQIDEFRSMVKAFHAAGIEVILDVVYNHAAEGNELGPTYSFKGLGNTTYYLLERDCIHYRNDTGTGNTLHCANPIVRKMILDSMRYWVTEMHVDGFRFDLASIFTRNDDGSLNLKDPPILSEINADPAFAGIRLIAEAWDVSTDELGRGFPGFFWLQWNGQFRDDVRSFVKGDEGKVGPLMTRLYGSDDLFPDTLPSVYHPYQSLNYVTSHDGFCLYDLVAYNQKHNEANGNNNTDGTDYNLSWNCGWEGDVGTPPGVLELRQRQIKNFCSILLLANGTPMFCAGDEFMRTQGGNNNPYNQDNETTWVDWDLLETNQNVYRFFKKMIAFRKSHPSLGRSRFWREDIRWYGTGGTTDLSPQSHTLAFCLRGASQNDEDIYVVINACWQDLTFTIQEGNSQNWKRVVDTSLASPDDFSDVPAPISSLAYPVKARSVVVFLRSPAQAKTAPKAEVKGVSPE